MVRKYLTTNQRLVYNKYVAGFGLAKNQRRVFMKVVFQHEKYGTIVYEESAWTGKKKLFINGTELKKIDRKHWAYETGGVEITVELKGSAMTGVALIIDGEKIQITPKPTWYVLALSILMFSFVVVWGASVELVKIFPIVGGALGGAISGACAILNVYVAGKVKNAGYKVLTGLAFFAVAVLICYLMAIALLEVI